mgnify:CR=1 FL=1
MLISTEYLDLQRQMHRSRPDYGIVGQRYAEQVKAVAQALDARTILDYGCGKRTLSRSLPGLPIRDYDPCIPGLDAAPDPADLVVCTDVLEHIELDCLDDVLDELRRLSLKGTFLTIATRPAAKFLPDGRNAHLIQEPASWWFPKLERRWDLVRFEGGAKEFEAFGVPRQSKANGQ